MYAFIDFCCFSLGVAAIVLTITYHHLQYLAIGIIWIPTYPIILQFIYNCFATCSAPTIYQGMWNSRIVYNEGYNISFFGVEKCHPFDSQKYGNVYRHLKSWKVINEVVKPNIIPRKLLLEVMNRCFLLKLTYTLPICKYLEMPLVIFPSFLLRWRVLNPMMRATEGSILSALIAVEKGWAINLSGGYHHANKAYGSGFCIYPDITMCVHYLRSRLNKIRIMIIDLDAHQGNGYERDLIGDKHIHIIDAYRPDIYPGDEQAKQAISEDVSVYSSTTDQQYLESIRCIEQSILDFQPQFIIYNAGTDIMKGDPLSRLNISAEAIIERDQYVFEQAIRNKVPICMLLSGGYQKTNAEVIAQSIANLYKHFE